MAVKPIELNQGRIGRLAELEAALSGPNKRILEFIAEQAGDSVPEQGEKTLGSALAIANYLRKDAALMAVVVEKESKNEPVFVIEAPHLVPGNVPQLLYNFLDNAGGISGRPSFKAEVAGIQDTMGLFLRQLDETGQETVIFYEVTQLPSRTSITRVFDVRPRAAGANAAAINATFRNANLGIVVKTTDVAYSRAEASTYAAIAEDSRIRSAAALISNLGATNVMTRITQSRLADMPANVPENFQYALKHAHMRQIALIQQAVARSPPKGQRTETIGPKLYDAISGVSRMAMDEQLDLLIASLTIDGLFEKGGYAARVDPTPYQTWLDGGARGIDVLIATASQPDEKAAFNTLAGSLYVSDFKRTLDLYPEFNDAIEASLTAGATSVDAIARGCRAFTAMKQFYSGRHTQVEQEGFHAALMKWDKSPTDEARAALTSYGVNLDIPDADMARICAMTAIRLLRWNHTTSQLKDISTADATMASKETKSYIPAAIQALQLARDYATKLQKPGETLMTLKQALDTAIKYASRLEAQPVAGV
ncbi:hypothetical protein HY640_03700 [Candidatus Woesearchaeota archaeon]|nr:hypothetical protein [Candidatus Woesearchaeota archaeon]